MDSAGAVPAENGREPPEKGQETSQEPRFPLLLAPRRFESGSSAEDEDDTAEADDEQRSAASDRLSSADDDDASSQAAEKRRARRDSLALDVTVDSLRVLAQQVWWPLPCGLKA